jgi:hypothetical protein
MLCSAIHNGFTMLHAKAGLVVRKKKVESMRNWFLEAFEGGLTEN